MKAVALRLSSKRMEIKAGDVEIAQRGRMLERIEPPECPALEFPSHPATSTFPKKLLKALVPEASNHHATVTSPITAVNEYVTEKECESI